MPLLTLRNLSLAYGAAPLLNGVSMSLDAGERIALIGRNGAGKSTLMRVMLGEVKPDGGEIDRAPGLRVAWLDQEVPAGLEGSVLEVVAGGLGETGSLLAQYEMLAARVADDPSHLSALEKLQARLEAVDGWKLHQQVQTTLSRLNLDGGLSFASLSGGLKRRVWLARALVTDPQLLLLDEPTNHLDIAAIEWLEQFLLEFRGACVFVTHDRAFLQRLATRIIDLERGRLTDYPGDWEKYLERKEAMLAAEAHANAEFDKKLAQEEAWIRQGIKARRTRNEGRVRALIQLRRERADRRERQGVARIETQSASPSGKRVIEAEGVSFTRNGETLIRAFSCGIERGDKIGIIGPNGVGKTTLLNLLLKTLEPTSGRVQHGTRLEIAYFDQLRAQLDPEKSVRDNLIEGADYVDINGKRKHVMGYLADFLFEPDRARQPVKALSGGERNRLLLARLFTRPANLLVLDEPTNDLDAETLDLLEERLAEFDGTVLLVSHDRAFLNNVVTSVFVFEGDGRVQEYVGGYDDWLRQRPTPAQEKPVPVREKPAPAPVASAPQTPARRKLGYKEQRELEALPGHIEQLETEQGELVAAMSDPGFFQRPNAEVMADQQRLADIEEALQIAYERWAALEG